MALASVHDYSVYLMVYEHSGTPDKREREIKKTDEGASLIEKHLL